MLTIFTQLLRSFFPWLNSRKYMMMESGEFRVSNLNITRTRFVFCSLARKKLHVNIVLMISRASITMAAAYVG